MSSLARTPALNYAARQNRARPAPDVAEQGWQIAEPPGLNAWLSRLDRRLVGVAGLWGTPILLALMLGWMVQMGLGKLAALHNAFWPNWFIIGVLILGLLALPAGLLILRAVLRRWSVGRLIKSGPRRWQGVTGIAKTQQPGPSSLSLPLPPPPSTRKLASLSAVLEKRGHSTSLLAMHRMGGLRLPAAGPIMAPFLAPPITTGIPPLRPLHRIAGGALAGLGVALPYVAIIAIHGLSAFSDHDTQSAVAIGFIVMVFGIGAMLQASLARVMQDILHLLFDPVSRAGLLLVSRDGIALQRHNSTQILSWAALRKPERPRAGGILRPRWGGLLRTGLPSDQATHLGQITAQRAMFAPQEAVRSPVR